MRIRQVTPSPDHKRFYDEATSTLQKLVAKYPQVRTLEIIAMFGQMAGICVAACYPDERDMARAVLIENMDQRCSEVAQDMPTRKGVDQR